MVRACGTMVALALTVWGCGDEPTGLQTAAGVRKALENAEMGDTVELASGHFEGPFEVKSGVDLRGAGRGETILTGPEGENVLTILPGDGATQISNLTVQVGQKAETGDEQTEIGIYMSAAGRVTLSRVEVDERYGIGIGAQDLEGLTLNDVTIAGHVTDGNQDTWPTPATPQNSPAHGIVVINGSTVSIDGLDVSGLSSTGIQLVDSNTTWLDGSVHGNMGASIFVSGGTADLEGVAVAGILKGVGLLPPYGMAIANGAVVDSADLSIQGDAAVDNGDSIGLVQDSAVSHHLNLSITDNGSYGLWVQNSAGSDSEPSLLLEAGHNDLSRNAGVGLGIIESSGVVVQDTVIEDTATLRKIIGDLSDVEIGDGIEIRRCAQETCSTQLAAVDIRSVQLHRNGRSAMIIEALDAPASGVNCGSVDVDPTGIGAVVQNNTDPPGGWGAIVNTGSADPLETVRGLDPDFNQGGSLDGLAGR